ncbi:hypothetical protein HMPREF9630_00245 [Peptoanaerobacter stomatis]|uniref:Plasmid maintenance system killer protein n=1 Tax=Peptoanaerobacter stomatis TaxID=796937 RepID=V9HRT3_9FIRM|nr:hypothetical protein [Peptoanaerobacter stomatis]EHL18520.1 hypothetical protein HMPREF9630_00245 [Peptoanaerobacter stomatis]
MDIIYKDAKTEKLCTNLKEATKKLNKDIAIKLMATINFIQSSSNLKDIISYPPYHFHNLSGKREGEFAIDIGGRKSGYRLILEPLDKNGERFKPCDIDKVTNSVKIILIVEVSNHYE